MESIEKWFEDFLVEVKNSKEYKEERALNLRQRITCKIKNHLKENKISNKALAEKMNCSDANISKILRGDNNFTLDSLNEIADALDTRLDFIFTARMSLEDLAYDGGWSSSSMLRAMGSSPEQCPIDENIYDDGEIYYANAG